MSYLHNGMTTTDQTSATKQYTILMIHKAVSLNMWMTLQM